MTKVEELRIRLRLLLKAQTFAKVEVGQKLMTCAVELLEQQDHRIAALESRPQLVGLEFQAGKVAP